MPVCNRVDKFARRPGGVKHLGFARAKLKFCSPERLFLAVALLFPTLLHAAPPYLAVDTLQGADFRRPCVNLAADVLKGDGFAKIDVYAGTGTVFAAYRKGADYGFKAVVKCLPGAVTVVVVADSLAEIKGKANALANALRSQASRAASPEESAYPPGYPVHDNPDCSDGPVRMRCLNSIPATELPLTLLYLEERRAEVER